MTDRAAQVEAIRKALAGGAAFQAEYFGDGDFILVVNGKLELDAQGKMIVAPNQLGFCLLPSVLDEPNDFYLDVARISFGRLLEALDRALEATPAQGRA